MTNDRIIKSYVWHDEECFFVSTIERDSSAAVSPPPRYHETLAWEFDWGKNERGDMVVQTGDGRSLHQHFNVCRQLNETGVFDSDA